MTQDLACGVLDLKDAASLAAAERAMAGHAAPCSPSTSSNGSTDSSDSGSSTAEGEPSRTDFGNEDAAAASRCPNASSGEPDELKPLDEHAHVGMPPGLPPPGAARAERRRMKARRQLIQEL
jgi:hypothetical protein